MDKVRVASIVTLIALATATPLRAQQGTAEISGKVTDEQGGSFPASPSS
jgi:hypothetical protein